MTITIRSTVSNPQIGRLNRSTRTNAALAAAIAAVAPEYLSISEQLERLTRTAAKVLPLLTDDDLAADLTARLAVGDDVPADLLTTVAGMPDAGTAWTRASTILNGIAQRLGEERDNLLHDRREAIQANLARQLADLFDTLPPEARNAPRSSQAAIAADAVEGFKAAQTAAATYATIRDAQMQLARATWSIEFTGPATWWPILGFIAAPDDAWHDLLSWRATGRARNEYGNTLPVTPPWPDLHTAEAFNWLLDHPKARPWIPTANEYDEAVSRLNTATDQPPKRERGDDPDPMRPPNYAASRL